MNVTCYFIHRILPVPLLFLLFVFPGYGQTEGFQIVHGAEIAVKLEDLASWNSAGFEFRLNSEEQDESYHKAVILFNRLNEFRRVNEDHVIELSDNAGTLTIFSWNQLGIKTSHDGVFARRKLMFSLNENQQLKEMFLD
jgi:hypothetical protein